MRNFLFLGGLLLISLMSFAGGSGGGGGGDRPGVPMAYNPQDPAEQEIRRRSYCARYPRNCEMEFPRGQCGDVYQSLETARRECSIGTEVRRVWMSDLWSCTCYELVRDGQN